MQLKLHTQPSIFIFVTVLFSLNSLLKTVLLCLWTQLSGTISFQLLRESGVYWSMNKTGSMCSIRLYRFVAFHNSYHHRY